MGEIYPNSPLAPLDAGAQRSTAAGRPPDDGIEGVTSGRNRAAVGNEERVQADFRNPRFLRLQLEKELLVVVVGWVHVIVVHQVAGGIEN